MSKPSWANVSQSLLNLFHSPEPTDQTEYLITGILLFVFLVLWVFTGPQ
jgi:hypothetical protein